MQRRLQHSVEYRLVRSDCTALALHRHHHDAVRRGCVGHVACCHSRCIGCTWHLVVPDRTVACCQASREESAAIRSFESLDDAEQFDVVLASDVLYEDVQVRLDRRGCAEGSHYAASFTSG